MTSPIVILNPVAGRGARSWSLYEAQVRERGGQIRATTRAGEARHLALSAIEAGAEVLVAAGGDGTLSEVAGAIIESKRPVRLGVFPIGTGNDFARTLGVWGNPRKALDAVFDGYARDVDAGVIECNGHEQTFINIAGCGFDSLVARRINDWGQRKTMRHIRGLNAYLLAVATELLSYSAIELTIHLDDELLETPAVLCAVANAQSYGGGMKVCPDADLSDGFFDVCIIGNATRSEFIRAFPGVFAGKHTTHPKVTMRRCRSIRVEATTKVPVLSDGEVLGDASFSCRLLPNALNFCIPKERG